MLEPHEAPKTLRSFHVTGSKLLKLRAGDGLGELVRTIREHSVPVTAPDATRAAALFRDHTGIAADTIDGRVVAGFCEGCDAPIFDGDEFTVTGDECLLCVECWPAGEGEGVDLG